MSKLSVIVPVYNVELYLEECVESLLVQTYKDLEIILVDDGSKDGSGAICDRFAEKHPNIKVVHQENRGLPFARNAGLDVAEGEYVGFVDSDDVVSPDMYEKMINRLEQTEADLVVCNFARFNTNGVFAVSTRYGEKVTQYIAGIESEFYKYAIDACWNKVYRHDIIKENSLRFEDKKIVAQEDFWFLVRYCCHISKIATIPDAFYHYRERGSSITRSGSDKDITTRCINFIELADKYTTGAGRKSQAFLEHMTLEMMYASINQFSQPTPKEIHNTVAQFRNTAYFQSAVEKKPVRGLGIKGYYDALKISLLHIGLYGVFSVLESARVRRLHSKTRVDDHFR